MASEPRHQFPTSSRLSWGSLCAAALILVAGGSRSWAADEPSPEAKQALGKLSANLVGSLGRKEALVFRGNTTFSSEDLLAALCRELDFFLAAHPAAPLADYPRVLERMLRAGYLRQGFAEVQVKAGVDAPQGRVLVQVIEGPRYKTGKVRFVGAAAIADPSLQNRLLEVLATGPPPASGGAGTNAQKGLWRKEGYAPFDEVAAQNLEEHLVAELANANFYQPKLKVTVVPPTNSREAELVVEMLDEGLKGTIDDIGTFYPVDQHNNGDDELQRFLDLKPGMALRANLISEITNRLWLSGRFLKHKATLAPLPEEGHFKLELDLEDVAKAPPLSQALSTNELVWLKFGAWLNDFQNQAYDLVFSCHASRSNHTPLEATLVLSKAGLAFSAQDRGSNGVTVLNYGIVASSNKVSCYSGWRRHKLVTLAPGTVTVYMTLLPNPAPKRSTHFDLTIGAGFNSKKSELPLGLDLKFAPASFLEQACEEGIQHAFKDGVLHSTFTGKERFGSLSIGIEAATGRLTEGRAVAKTNDWSVVLEVRTEKGAFEQAASDLVAAAASYKDDYVAAHPKSSWLGFITADLLESGVLESAVISNYLARSFSAETALRLTRQAGEIRGVLGRLKTALGKGSLAECLMPLEDKLKPYLKTGRAEGAPEGEEFVIPVRPTAGQSSMSMMLAMFGAWVVDMSDALWPRGTWPWTLTRETAFTAASRNPYTAKELGQLLDLEQTGPLGCWAAAALLARLNAPLAEKFARTSLERMSPPHLQRDLEALLGPTNAIGQVVAEVLLSLGRMKADELENLAGFLGPEGATFVREAARSARAGSNQPPAAALRPAIAQGWEPFLRLQLEAPVKQLLARLATPTDPQAAFVRGNFILQTARKPAEFEEAVKAFRFAAERGYAAAQLRLGGLYYRGQGVNQDYAAALRWFLKAAELNEPHAACRVGDLYFAGQGVARDKAAAVKWYEREAQRECGHAQFRLGECAEERADTALAFGWFRRAATNGFARAQLTLGERLSDNLMSQPDYPEAFLWYQMAAEGGDRVAAVSARRVKARLSPEQIEQAEKEVRKLRKRLEEQSSR